jgi:hypothetical protein
MMNDLASLIDFLPTSGLLAIAIGFLMWLARGSDSLAGGLFGLRSDAYSPPVPEEIDPPRWRIELLSEASVTSGRTHRARVERPAFRGDRLTVPLSSEDAHAE